MSVNAESLRQILAKFWNPNLTDAVRRLLQEWDSDGLPSAVTVERDYDVPCSTEYQAYGHIRIGDTVIADIYRYVELPSNLDEMIKGLRSVREVNPSARTIYSLAAHSLVTATDRAFGVTDPGHVLLVERVPLDQGSAYEESKDHPFRKVSLEVPTPSGSMLLRDWVQTLPGTVGGAYQLLSVSLQLDNLFNLLVETGFDGNLESIAYTHVVPVNTNATVSCYGVEIATYGSVPFLTNCLHLKRGPAHDSIRDPRAILRHVLSMAIVMESPVAKIILPIRNSLDTRSFTSPLDTYIEFAPSLASTSEQKRAAKTVSLSCRSSICEDADTLYDQLRQISSLRVPETSPTLHGRSFTDRSHTASRGENPLQIDPLP